MKILKNPDNGAPIKNIWFKDKLYFDSTNNQTFKPGDIVKIEEDEVADFIIKLFGFVKTISPEEAKSIIEAKKNNTFKCDKCDYSTNEEIKLRGHKMSHAKEAKIDEELGIPVISGSQLSKENEEKQKIDTQQRIDNEGTQDGLTGEGLVRENNA